MTVPKTAIQNTIMNVIQNQPQPFGSQCINLTSPRSHNHRPKHRQAEATADDRSRNRHDWLVSKLANHGDESAKHAAEHVLPVVGEMVLDCVHGVPPRAN